MYQSLHRGVLPSSIRAGVPPGFAYLGEDDRAYYFVGPAGTAELGGFFDGLGNMFKRMVKFTPKSFTPGNLYKGFVNTTLGVASGGLIYALPKSVRKSIYNVGKIAIPVVAAGVGAYYAGPAVMGVLGPKLSSAASILGKNIGTIGSKLFEFIGKIAPSKQAAVASQITPEQIVQMETSQTLPSELVPLFQNAMQGSLPGSQYGGYSSVGVPSEQPTDSEGGPAPSGGNAGVVLALSALGLYLTTRR